MSIRSLMHVVGLCGTFLLVAGCGGSKSGPSSPAPATGAPAEPDHHSEVGHDDHGDAGHGHSNVRGQMMIADAGPYHVLLTAHLSKGGNELGIFFETSEAQNPQPVAIALGSFEAQATGGEGESQTLRFEPARPDERPAGGKSGTYSHFVAKAPWMKPDDELLIVARFTVNGQELVARWKDFVPQKFAHHVE